MKYLFILLFILFSLDLFGQEIKKIKQTSASLKLHSLIGEKTSFGTSEGISAGMAFYKGKWGPKIGLSLFFFEDESLTKSSAYKHIPEFRDAEVRSYFANAKDVSLGVDIGIARLDKNIAGSRFSMESYLGTGVKHIGLSDKVLHLESGYDEPHILYTYGQFPEKILVPIKAETSILFGLTDYLNLALGAHYSFSFTKLDWEYILRTSDPYYWVLDESSSRIVLSDFSLSLGLHLIYPTKTRTK